MTDDAPTLAYATAERHPPSVWALVVLAATGLGLVALGGCFLIGVLVLFEPPLAFGPTTPVAWTPGRAIFCAALYTLAFVCFAGAVAVLVPTVRATLRAAC